jgi:hypothetical protein
MRGNFEDELPPGEEGECTAKSAAVLAIAIQRLENKKWSLPLEKDSS